MKRSVVAIFIGGMALGGVLLLGSLAAFEYTNTTEFCISCHEMGQTVYQEYLKSPHYKTPSGVTAGCPDCHVPRAWGPKIVRKIQATNELYQKFITGSIGTPELFEEKRLELAEHVWAYMETTDSRECRECHNQSRMDFHKQSRRAQEKMEQGLLDGKTCIDCHKGIAHKKPREDD